MIPRRSPFTESLLTSISILVPVTIWSTNDMVVRTLFHGAETVITKDKNLRKMNWNIRYSKETFDDKMAETLCYLLRFLVFAFLLYIIHLFQDYRHDLLTEFQHRSMPSCRLKAESWTFVHRRLRVTAWKTVMNVSTRFNRLKATTTYHDNSTSAFRQILQKLHDKETNPGPALNYSTNASEKTNGNVSIAYL